MRAYRALLHLYPASFRAEYGGELSADFARRCRAASGATGVIGLWLGAVGDTLANAARVQWDVLQKDVKYTLRQLARAPGFAATAVLVSALGIGATTATFTMADHVLVRPLPFREPDRLVRLWQDQSFRGYPFMEASPPNFFDWQHMSRSFERMGIYTDVSVNLLGAGPPERIDGADVSADLLPTLGVQPEVGRLFAEADDRPGAPGTIIISHGFWVAQFAGDPRVLGRTLVLDDEAYTIIGVMPRGFDFPDRDAEFWRPFRFVNDESFQDRTNYYLYPVARLRDGVALEAARAEMKVIAARLERAFPKENRRTGIGVYLLRDSVSDRARLMLAALIGGSLCLLLIACTNLAALLVSRAVARQREFAVRCAIGAGRERLVRQMLTESLLLAIAGGALGIALALAAEPLVARLVPVTLPIAETPPLDLRMLAIAAVLTLATGIGFGFLPALRATGNAAEGLREGMRTGVSRRTERLRSALVVAQVTACVVLLMTSGLLLRALWRVQNTDPGFVVEGIQTLRTALPLPRYDATARRTAFYRRVIEGVRQLPGVRQAAYISYLPMTMRGGIWEVVPEGRTTADEASPTASLRFVTPQFFETMGIPLRLGRDVTEADEGQGPFVAVVSESFAKAHWPGLQPIGQRFTMAFRPRTIVGVVGDVKVRGLERSSEPQVYLPDRQQVPDGSLIGYTPKDLVISASTSPDVLMPAVRRIIAAADPQQPISDVRPLAAIVDSDTAPRQVQVRVLAAFGTVAFLLAGIGIHGLLAFTVAARARELAVRIALGAQNRDIVSLVLRRAVALGAIGAVLGVAAGRGAGQILQTLLAGVSPTDAAVVTASIALCLLVTMVGSLVPAFRAVRTSPIEAMRAE
jgi:putative ABC transport system permease protein